MEPKPEKKNDQLTLLGKFIGDLQNIMPEMAQKNLVKVCNRLLYGVADIPVAFLEEHARKHRRKTEILDTIAKSNAESISEFIRDNPDFARENLNYTNLKEYTEYFNRQRILKLTTQELNSKPSTKNESQPIDLDWLEMFSRVVEVTSAEQMRLIFSRILSGEIHKPGSFSRRTIQTLSLIDKECAHVMLNFCSSIIRMPILDKKYTDFVIQEVLDSTYWPQHGQNHQKASKDILILQEHGLIHSKAFQHSVKSCPHLGTLFLGKSRHKFDKKFKYRNQPPFFNTYSLTKTGEEIRNVITPTTNPGNVNESYIKWLSEYFHFD